MLRTLCEYGISLPGNKGASPHHHRGTLWNRRKSYSREPWRRSRTWARGCRCGARFGLDSWTQRSRRPRRRPAAALSQRRPVQHGQTERAAVAHMCVCCSLPAGGGESQLILPCAHKHKPGRAHAVHSTPGGRGTVRGPPVRGASGAPGGDWALCAACWRSEKPEPEVAGSN